MKEKIQELLEKDYKDLTDEEIELMEDRICELEKLLDYFDRRDKVCCSIDGEQERYEVESEIEQIQDILY